MESKTRESLARDMVPGDNWVAYTRLRDHGHLDYVKRASKFNGYYTGDEHWEEQVAKALDDAGRPHHTINLVLSTVNAVLGEQISTREELTFKPVTADASAATAEALTRLADHVQENSHSKWVETQVVADGLIEERGFFDMRMSYADNIFGDIREGALDPRDVLLDPGAKDYDPRTWAEVMVSRWWTPDEIEAQFGQKIADKIRYVDPGSSYGTDSLIFDVETFAQDKGRYAIYYSGTSTFDDEFRRVQRARVLDRQFYKLGECFYFVDPVHGDERKVPDAWNEEQRDAFAMQWGLRVYRRTVRRVRWWITCDNVTLFDDWSPYDRFTVIPFFPYFRRGRPFGLVTNLVSMQDLLNKTASQELHVVNTSANSGWIFQSGSLQNMTTRQLEQVGAKTGLVLEYGKGYDPPTKIQPNQIPTGLDRMTEKAGSWFREVSGVSDAMLGMPGREISGVALDAKEQRGLVQLQVVLDNLARTRQLRAEFMLYLFQHFYTEPRLLQILNRNYDGSEQYVDLGINQPTPEGDILNDLTLGEYRVVVSSTPVRDNQDETTFAKLMALREAGVLLPDHAIIQVAGLGEKTAELVEYAKQMAGMLEPSEEEIARQQAMEELQMRLLSAQAAEAEAKASERLANVELIIAKAESEGQKIPAELQKMGAELRVEMERMKHEREMNQADINARLMIAGAKNKSVDQAGAVSAMSKRLSEGAQERQASRDLLVKLAEQRAEQRMERVRMAHEARIKEREFQLKRQESKEKLAMQREQHKQKLQFNRESANQKMALAKQQAKAKPAAAKPTSTRK